MANCKNRSITFDAVKIVDVAECFHVSRRAVQDWVERGCPRNPDKTMSINVIHKWLLQRDTAKGEDNNSLKEQKLVEEINLLKLKIKREEAETVPRELYEAVNNTRAKDWTENWQRLVMKNAVYLAMKTVDEIKVLVWKLLCEASGYMADDK